MAFQIIKNLTVTRVKYQLVELPDGIPTLVPQPDAVFRGIVPKERVKKLLAQRHGVDATIFIVDIDSGPHRFVMDFEDFVRTAQIEDKAKEDKELNDNEDVEKTAGIENANEKNTN